jgi:hypothetical protein
MKRFFDSSSFRSPFTGAKRATEPGSRLRLILGKVIEGDVPVLPEDETARLEQSYDRLVQPPRCTISAILEGRMAAWWLLVLWAATVVAERRDKLALLGFGDRRKAHQLRFSLPNKRAYCARHGYTFISQWESLVQGNRTAHWNKVALILRHLAQYDWVVWMDADVLITNFAVKLEKFTQNTTNDLLVSRSPISTDGRIVPALNSGVLFVRNTPWAQSFFQTVWAAGSADSPGACKRWEPVTRQIQLTPCKWDPRWGFQTWSDQDFIVAAAHRQSAAEEEERIQYFAAKAFNNRPYLYEPGDFVVHFPGALTHKNSNAMYGRGREGSPWGAFVLQFAVSLACVSYDCSRAFVGSGTQDTDSGGGARTAEERAVDVFSADVVQSFCAKEPASSGVCDGYPAVLHHWFGMGEGRQAGEGGEVAKEVGADGALQSAHSTDEKDPQGKGGADASDGARLGARLDARLLLSIPVHLQHQPRRRVNTSTSTAAGTAASDASTYVATVHVHEGDSAAVLAFHFCRRHNRGGELGYSERQCERLLTEHIAAKLEAEGIEDQGIKGAVEGRGRGRALYQLHRADARNVGDLWSAPLRYFHLPLPMLTLAPPLSSHTPDAHDPGKTHVTKHGTREGFVTGFPRCITDRRLDSSYTGADGMGMMHADDVVMVGGGGLLSCMDEWDRRLLALTHRSTLVVGWGVGLNMHGGMTSPVPMDILRSFRLVGLRDRDMVEYVNQQVENSGHAAPHNRHAATPPSIARWVPCASCMHPGFDPERRYPIERTVGVYEHRDHPVMVGRALPAADRMNNTEVDLWTVLRFIAGSEVLVTSTYHGLYWGTLLRRKVVLANVFSSKFTTFPYTPVMLDDQGGQPNKGAGDALDRAAARAVVYPHALAECREANTRFFEEVTALLART